MLFLVYSALPLKLFRDLESTNNRPFVSIYSSIRVDIFGSASSKHRPEPCQKRVVELKLHRKSLTRMVCICTYSYNVSNFGFWRSACDIRPAKMIMMIIVIHSVMHSCTKSCSVHGRRSVARELRSGTVVLMRHRS